jgi:hypothetical protein
MNAPPISETTFIVEVARSARLDVERLDAEGLAAEGLGPEPEFFAEAPGDAELLCANDGAADSPAKIKIKTRSANKALDLDSN